MIGDVRKFLDLMTRRERARLALLLLALCALAFANMIGVASIVPFLSAVARPEMVRENAYLAYAYDAFGFTSHENFVTALGVVFLVLFTGSILVRAVSSFVVVRFSQYRAYSISRRLLNGYLSKDYVWFLDRRSADLLKLLITETTQVVSSGIVPLLRLVSYALTALFVIALLVVVDWRVAFVIAAVLTVSYLGIFHVTKGWLTRVGQLRVDSNTARFRVAQETLTTFKAIKILGLETRAARRYDGPAKQFAHALSSGEILAMLPQVLVEGVAFAMAVVALIVAYRVSGGDIAEMVPIIGLYLTAGTRLLPALKVMMQEAARVRFTTPSLAALHAEYVEIARSDPPPPPKTLALRERIALRDVRFTYPGADRPALDGLSLEIPIGSTVGFVGGTGAGKTTAIDIVLGLIAPDSGTLEIDGAPLRDEEARRAWRSAIGYVPQQISLLAGSVRENIALGALPGEIDEAAVERAARIAQLHDFVVQELPQGYDTQVGEHGVKLSGGQRQRIGIARALYRNPAVLVLDEATSALDNITEAAFMRALAAFDGRKTVLMIAHRLSTVRDCDEIFVLEAGRCAARGNYAALLAEHEAFRRLAKGAA